MNELGFSNSITNFGLTNGSQDFPPFFLNSGRDQFFKKQIYNWKLPFLFKVFVIKILTDGFRDPSSLIRILRHIFKSLLITQQSWREEACQVVSVFFSLKIIQDSPRKKKKKEAHFCVQLVRPLFWDYRDLAICFRCFFFFFWSMTVYRVSEEQVKNKCYTKCY